jgi:hypothetical protein
MESRDKFKLQSHGERGEEIQPKKMLEGTLKGACMETCRDIRRIETTCVYRCAGICTQRKNLDTD